jgi:hypothetical protein
LAFRRITLFALGLSLATATAHAAPIQFWSGDEDTRTHIGTSTGTVLTRIVTPHAAWGDVNDEAGLAPNTARWISYENSGVGGVVVGPNVAEGQRNIGNQTAYFEHAWWMGDPFKLSLWVLADDTATVQLYKYDLATQTPTLVATPFTAFQDQIDPCAPGGSGIPIGCVEADMGVWETDWLPAGSYFLRTYAFQTNSDVFGVQYAGELQAAPEPASLLLLGSGLLGLASAWKRRRQQ